MGLFRSQISLPAPLDAARDGEANDNLNPTWRFAASGSNAEHTGRTDCSLDFSTADPGGRIQSGKVYPRYGPGGKRHGGKLCSPRGRKRISEGSGTDY